MHKTLHARVFLTALLPIVTALPALAQSSSVLDLGTVPVSQVQEGLGFNLNPSQDWQWQAAAAAGAKHARFQCSWSSVEQQTPAPANANAGTRYVEDPNCAAGFASALKYGIQPTVVAAYGPPYHPILTVTVPNGAPVGATSFVVEYAQGIGGDTLANLRSTYDYMCPVGTRANTCGPQFSLRHSYQGTLVAAVSLLDPTHARVTLASALTQALPAGAAPYLVNEILYPSAASESSSDAAVNAYTDYVQFLADDMASRGVKGDIEIWNEPPWANDPWDFRAALYDPGLYTGSSESGANFGFAANLMKRTFPSGITATWNGTSGSGMSSLLGPRMVQYSGETLTEPSTVFTKESFHPYGGPYANPEEQMFQPACLQGTAAATGWPENDPFANGMRCQIPGTSQTSNALLAIQGDMKEKLINPSYGLGHSVTETNIVPPTAGLRVQQARGVMRQFIGFEANGVTPVEFFVMYDPTDQTDPNFSFVQQVGTTSTYTGNPDYTAISAFMQDMLPISNAPATNYSSNDLPSVASYTGTYPLATAKFVGARDSANQNSIAYLLWQVSACTTSSNCWFRLGAPPAAPVTVNIPGGMKVDAVIDTVTRANLPHNVSGSRVTVAVSDNPIELILDPASYAGTSSTSTSSGLVATTLALVASPASSTFGQKVVLTASVKPSNSGGHNTNGALVSFFDGPTLLGTAPINSGSASLTLNNLPAGQDTVAASFPGTSSFFPSSGKTTATVLAATPVITIPAIANQVTTSAAFTVAATSTSPAQMYYKILSGPARISAYANGVSTVQVMGAGSVVLQAYQAATTNYSAGSSQVSFTVGSAQDPGLTFTPVGTQTYGEAPFQVSANSKSLEPITYTLGYGPAKVSGNTVTLTGTGTVMLVATQPLGGAYLSSLARVTFNVLGEAPTITLPQIANQVTTSAPFTVKATSTSPNTMYYKILSGPARIAATNNGTATVQIQGAGTVVLQAYQVASGKYAGGSTQQTFTIQAAQDPGLAFNAVATQTYGTAPLHVAATSKSSAPVTYTLGYGPAIVSGNSVTLTGTGTVMLVATQPEAGAYLSSLARVTFTVQGEAPTLTLPGIPTKTTGTAPFTVAARSSSPAPVYYKVLSGPARISAWSNSVATVQVMGAGSVVLQAYQNAQGNYASSAVSAAFAVGSK